MITFHKRVLVAGAPAIIGTICLATALGAAETLTEDAEAVAPQKPEVTDGVDTGSSGKGDLKMDLADTHSRPMRCVSGNSTTTCTGWPIAAGILAYKN
ncbi:hypothetical protein [Roseibium sediminicola]|uniref:Secreted protein n=1 Tax=Roseibium sediminicola TaxID=2933272 RepID=A0ABT0H089_9HYPH|nr:hypothetical protein [Roseibium sp. CAU 1639]MCK7615108.1 hypothetical protein [Roseibium sp. CAU 1639]